MLTSNGVLRSLPEPRAVYRFMVTTGGDHPKYWKLYTYHVKGPHGDGGNKIRPTKVEFGLYPYSSKYDTSENDIHFVMQNIEHTFLLINCPTYQLQSTWVIPGLHTAYLVLRTEYEIDKC